MIAYILTGGEGIRVKEVTDKYNCMKHEIPINGRPFIQHMKDWMNEQHIIDGYMELGKPYVGTAGAIKDMHARAPFLLVYGDCFCPINVDDLYHRFNNWCTGMDNPDMVIVTRTVDVPDYGWIAATEHGKVLKYQRHHDYSYYNTNIGTYMIGERAYEYIRSQSWKYPAGDHMPGTLSLEYDIFNSITKILNVYTYDCTELPYYDVGTPERIQITEGLFNASD